MIHAAARLAVRRAAAHPFVRATTRDRRGLVIGAGEGQTALVRCPRCETPNPEHAKFCLECGGPLGDAGRAVREERKVLTVLFADLVGFTSQSELLDPEEVRAILQPYHASLREDLERYGGTVEKFIGDAVMALFGAPVAHEDDPDRAVRAGLAIRDTLAHDGRLHVRIGITTGEALVSLEARPDSGEGMAAGNVVNTAARLQAAAPVDGILVDETTFRATSRTIAYRDHEPLSVKGRSGPIAVHEAISARARAGIDVRQLAPTPLVGRIREMQLVTDALSRARSEREPQLVTLVGVPGIGKSRIVSELIAEIEAGTEPIDWRVGRSLPYAEGISFWALGEIVKTEAGIVDTDSADDAVARLARLVADLVDDPSEAERIVAQLRPLVGAESGPETHGDRRGEAFAAWRRFLEVLADRRPLVLVFEDLHRADDGLLDFIDHVVGWASGVPLMILGTGRPELLGRRPSWGGGYSNALTMSLSRLTDSETSALVAALVEHAVIPDRARETVLERAQGNPLYAEEFARLVAGGGTLDDLPESVQGVIAARLDTLGRSEKEVLQLAAIVGKLFWSGTVAHLRGARAGVDEALHSLERREFIRRERRSSAAGETEYAFRHILIRDVAYGQIPRGERAGLHAAAAEWIESLGRPADSAELVGQHYLAAIEMARAAGSPAQAYVERGRDALRDAGERAMTLNAFTSAVGYLAAALELTPPGEPRRPTLLFQLGKARRMAEEGGDEELAEAETLLRASGDLGTAAEAAVLRAELAWFAGDADRTSEHLARAAQLVRDLPPSYSKAFVLTDLSQQHMQASRWQPSIALGREALGIAEALGFDEIRAHALNNIGTSRVGSGDWGGVEDLESAIEIGKAANLADTPRALNNLAACFHMFGEPMRGEPLVREALVRAREVGNAAVARWAEGSLASTAVWTGSWDEALGRLDRFISGAESAGGHALEAECRTARGLIRQARGDGSGAARDWDRALVAARRSRSDQGLVRALAFVAWLKVGSGRRSEADPLVDEAMDVVIRAPQAADPPDLRLAITLVALDRADDLARIVGLMSRPTRWLEVYSLLAGGRTGEAADLTEAIGLLPEAAHLQMMAAEPLVVDGHADEARARLDRAIQFWRSVGASQFLEEAEDLRRRITPREPDHVPARTD